MLNFKEFLKEENRPLTLLEELILEAKAATAESEADDKGKMHELLLSEGLHPEKRLPDHHRSESENLDHAGTPEQVHQRLSEKMGPTAMAEIRGHSKQSAEKLHQYLKDNGHLGEGESISNVFWTSNPDKIKNGKVINGDHHKTTGIHDPNSTADLIARITDKNGNQKHIGISAKYGSQEPNFKNPGLESLETMSGLKPGTLNAHSEAHRVTTDKLGYKGSADNRNYQSKIDEMAGKGGIDAVRQELAKHQGTLDSGKTLTAKNKLMYNNAKAFVEGHDSLPEKERAGYITHAAARVAAARASNIESRKSMAKDLHKAFSAKKPEELENMLRNAVSPKTAIPHLVVHTKVKDDGSAETHIKPMESIADEHFSQFDMSTLKPELKAGTSIAFKAYHHGKKRVMNVARINVKSSSGPHKTAVGGLKLKD